MRELLRITLLIFFIISGAVTLVLLPLGVLEYILGPPILKKWFVKINFPLSYKQFLYVAFISVGVLLITYALRVILFEV